MYEGIKKRLRNMPGRAIREAYVDIEMLILQGAYFDELSPEMQEKYKRYKESLGGVADDLAGAYLDCIFCDTPESCAYHFKLSRRERPPTPEEFAARVREIQELMESGAN